ncbi:hypothetical protein DOS86_03780 [Anaplasma marginale]|uniref:hypothetical protein n=1 Tax=Anaplasma marginale TaxID=770 RepID=UPI000DEF0845|nr:hypothetical protein [Anaplasma marginale]RCL19587.1 hypothetical protein DOS86_03780 [Anaplasma marginale]
MVAIPQWDEPEELWGRRYERLGDRSLDYAENCDGTAIGVGKLMATVLRVIPVSARVDVEVLGEW